MWKASIVVTVVVAAVAVLVVRNPVVFEIHESGDPVGEPAWSMMNPIRNRSPERASEAMPDDLKRGADDEAFSRVALSAEQAEEMKESERTYRIREWDLVGRTDRNDTSRLFYRVARGKSKETDSPVWITVKRVKHKWVVTDYEAWY